MNELEEKVSKVRTLLDQRAGIDAELRELLGIEPLEGSEPMTATMESQFESKAACIRHFIKEDKEGNMSTREILEKVHQAGFEKATHADIYMAKKKMKKDAEDREERGEADEEEIDEESDEEESISKDLIAQSRFEAVKRLQDEEHTSLSVAHEAELHIGTVNKIFSCFDWNAFQKAFPNLVKPS